MDPTLVENIVVITLTYFYYLLWCQKFEIHFPIWIASKVYNIYESFSPNLSTPVKKRTHLNICYVPGKESVIGRFFIVIINLCIFV